MSESTTNSTASSSDLDNVPLVRFINRGQEPPEIQNIEMVEYSEVTSGFVSECHNDEESTAGTVTEEESENEATTDEVPIDIPHTLEQKPSESWPTLQILPGGVIKPSDTAEYPMNIYGQNDGDGVEDNEEDNDLMYACAKCPERFKQLFCLVKHVKWHDDQKKREQGKDLSKLIRKICCSDHSKQLTGGALEGAGKNDCLLEKQERNTRSKHATDCEDGRLKNDFDCLLKKQERLKTRKRHLSSALYYSKNIQSKLHSKEIEMLEVKYLYQLEQAKLEMSLAEENIKLREQLIQYNKQKQEIYKNPY